MKLSHEYNEYVVGLVVTDELTERAVNFQYHPIDSNHPEPNYKLRYGCLGDDTHQNFTPAELQLIDDYVDALPAAEKMEKEITALHHSHLKDDMQVRHATQGYLSAGDILELYGELDQVYAISVNGSLTEYSHFETREAAQAEIDAMDDEDAYLCKIFRMSLDEFNAYCIIEEYATSTQQAQDIAKSFDDPAFSDSKAFVAKNLAKLGLGNDLNKAYFKYLIAGVYSIVDHPVWNCADEPDGNYSEPQDYEAFAMRYIENLIVDVFDKKINLADLL